MIELKEINVIFKITVEVIEYGRKKKRRMYRKL